jgi:hypothetical protein
MSGGDVIPGWKRKGHEFVHVLKDDHIAIHQDYALGNGNPHESK